MKNQYLPCCFYPTTVLLVDDDESITQSLQFSLADSCHCIPFQNPNDAITFLNHYSPDPFTERCLVSGKKHGFEDRNLSVHIDDIHVQLYSPDRFDEVSVIVVDFAMPEMNGTQVCRAISNTSPQKIMLTGEATEHQGIKAFNAGIIDRFFSKGSIDVMKNFPMYLKETQISYFQEQSDIIIKSFEKADAPPPHCLFDAELVKPVFEILQQNNIVEYYLTSNEGYFLTIDSSGKAGWFILHSEDEIDTLRDLIDHVHSDRPCQASANIIKDLSKNKITLFFASDHEAHQLADHWIIGENILKTHTISTSKTHYYWALAPFNPDNFQLESFTSFSKK